MLRNIIVPFRYLVSSLLLSGLVSALPPAAHAECPQCCSTQGSCEANNKCCRPNYTKIIIKRSSWGGGPFIGAAPPQGFAVGSVPAMMVATPTFAMAPASFNTAPAGLSTADIRSIADEMRRQTAAPTAAAAADRECNDPCGSIKQLRQDVDRLILVTDRLTVAVDKLADLSKK